MRLEAGAGTLDVIAASLCRSLAREESVSPLALLFLLDRYAATERLDLAEAIGPALAVALYSPLSKAPRDEQAGWLRVFARATTVADDVRVKQMVMDLADGLASEVGADGVAVVEVDEIRGDDVPTDAHAIEARLEAATALQSPERLRAAVESLERLIGDRYEPGRGMGSLDNHVACASMLLTAFSLTGRLPYSMLAEELMQTAIRTAWNAELGHFVVDAQGRRGRKVFELNSEAAQVCCRLASLHRDESYRQRAVMAVDTDYLGRAEHVLASFASRVPGTGVGAAEYGLAFAEWLNLK